MLVLKYVQALMIIVVAGFSSCTRPNQRIFFPTSTVNELPLGASCKTTSNAAGTCRYYAECPKLHLSNEEPAFCSTSNMQFIVCCPNLPPVVRLPPINVSPPYLHYKPGPVRYGDACGSTGDLTVHSSTINGEYVRIYALNKTLEKLRNEGSKISNVKLWGDAVTSFTYTNANGTNTMALDENARSAVLPVGGELAFKQRAYYMALIGVESSKGINWVCDGVVLNLHWVLSAAHCFIEPSIEPNIVRLGDYNWGTEDTTDEFYGEFVPVDFTIDKLVIYPEFKVDERYHDLILIKLSRGFPMFSLNICPVCLPWGDDVNRKHVGNELDLSGWGATEFNGQKTKILHQVRLTVFKTSVCDKSYSSLLDYRIKWPQGMTPDKILCIGSLEGGKDACKGDSGAPVVYQARAFTLAGIVSGGYGCGLKDYPGIYIPINNPHYMTWIKTVAFADHEEASNFNIRGERIN